MTTTYLGSCADQDVCSRSIDLQQLRSQSCCHPIATSSQLIRRKLTRISGKLKLAGSHEIWKIPSVFFFVNSKPKTVLTFSNRGRLNIYILLRQNVCTGVGQSLQLIRSSKSTTCYIFSENFFSFLRPCCSSVDAV